MNIKKMTREELELLSYNDIAYLILKDTNEKKSTAELFKTIQKLLDLTDEEYVNRIGDFYTTLTTDKRFFSKGKGIWDLKERNIVKIIIDDDDDVDIEVSDLDSSEEEELEEKVNDDYDSSDEDDDIDDDDLEEYGINEEDVLEEDKFEDE